MFNIPRVQSRKDRNVQPAYMNNSYNSPIPIIKKKLTELRNTDFHSPLMAKDAINSFNSPYSQVKIKTHSPLVPSLNNYTSGKKQTHKMLLKTNERPEFKIKSKKKSKRSSSYQNKEQMVKEMVKERTSNRYRN